MNRLTLNLVQGAVSFNFSHEAAKQLQTEISRVNAESQSDRY